MVHVSSCKILVQFSSVQLLSHVQLYKPMNRSTPGLSVHHQLPEFTQTHVHWVSDAIQPLHPLSSPCPPALSLSQPQSLFKWVSSSHQVAKVLGVSASISVLPNEYSGLISFSMDWLDLLAVQGTLEAGYISDLRILAQWKMKYTFLNLLFIHLFLINLFILIGG